MQDKSIVQAAQELGADTSRGLSAAEAAARLEKYGPNALKEGKKKSMIKKIAEQFSDFLVLTLIGAAAVSYAVGSADDSIVILAIVVLNAALGIYQEGQAEKSVEALQKMSAPSAKVLRDGTAMNVPASDLVPGDLVQLDAGDIIPADLRLIEASNLKVEEASLTGESVPVEKDAEAVLGSETGLGDRVNMAYMSTVVTYGRAKGIVTATGESTEMGKIAAKLKQIDDEMTPLQKKLNQLGKVLGFTTLVICFLVFIVGLLQGRNTLEMVLTAISLAVAAIPEGLPAIVTVVLSIGMNRMAKRGAIVKKLLAVETLGATSTICSDKTGTLTQNEMTVTKLFSSGKTYNVEGIGYEPAGEIVPQDGGSKDDLFYLIHAGVLANDAKLIREEGKYSVMGDPTEGALVTLAGKYMENYEKPHSDFRRVNEIPFDSDRKMMTSFNEGFEKGKVHSFTKGAPDIILSRCSSILYDGKEQPLSDAFRAEIEQKNSEFSRRALRVLAFAYRKHDSVPEKVDSETVENDMVFIGLMGMIDPARPEAKVAISETKEAGIDTIMITGDYKETAYAIAKDLGIARDESEVIAGAELDSLNFQELREMVKRVRVYARVSPEHKVRIVDGLKANGEIVSMTGDGVNDAMALKRADIGVAMGITGTDVAKNTADLILTDDNFATIVNAVEEGRIIYANIKKFVTFLLSCNIGEILLVFISILMNLQMPLLPIQLLWLNLVTDSFPAMALGVEKGEPDIMKRNPRDPEEPILNKRSWTVIISQAIAIAAATLLAYEWGLRKYAPDQISHARTIVFTTLITAELLRAFSSRSERYTIFKIGIFSNMKMVWAVLVSFMLLLIVLYVPFLNGIFHTFPLGVTDWEIVLSFAFIPLIIGELGKVLFKKL